MNTYDFDKTVFYPDSSACFCMFILKKYPYIALRIIPVVIPAALSYFSGKKSAKELKERVFSFLSEIEDIDAEVCEFWKKKYHKIGSWYLRQRRDDDIIISASPEFLLQPLCAQLKVRLIATRMDKHSGRISGENNHGIEKVRRFYELYPDAHTENFYSDSLADAPMAEIADRAYMIKKHRIYEWPASGSDTHHAGNENRGSK